jgi:serine/threonine protein kinase
MAAEPNAVDPPTSRQPVALVGRVIAGRYEVLEVVGEGPLLIALRARDRALNRVVAVKALLRGRIPAEGGAITQTLRDGWSEILSLNHPNITRALDVGADDDLAIPVFVAEEYVRGIDLKERIRRAAPFQLAAATDCTIALAEALEFAHARGIAHGDVRPQNVLIGPEGQVKLSNFGVAEAQNIALYQDPTLLRRVVAYIAPDAAATARPTISADLYALGIVLFEMLTGDVPFKGDNPLQIALKHAQEPAPSPRAINPAVPRALEGIVLKALEKRPEDRYLSAAGMLVDLREVRDALRYGKSLAWSPRTSASTPTAPLGPVNPPEAAPGGVAPSAPATAVATAAGTAGLATATTFAAVSAPHSSAAADPELVRDSEDPPTEQAGTSVMPRTGIRGVGALQARRVAAAPPPPPAPDPPPVPTVRPSPPARGRNAARTRVAAVARVEDDDEDEPPMNPRRSRQRGDGGGSRWLTFINLFLLLAVIGGLGTLVYYSMNLFQSENDVVVPNLVGKSMTDVQGMAIDQKFTLAIVDQQYEDAIPADTVYRQQPVPGYHIRENKQVSIWVSKGPHLADVPDVKEMSLERARQTIEASGLRVDPREYTYEYDPVTANGDVLRQTPEAGESRPRGTLVQLVISKGDEPPPTPEPMPSQPAVPPLSDGTDAADGGAGNPDDPSNRQRTFGVAWPVPKDGQSHSVRIDVIDRNGERTVYEQDNDPGSKVQVDVTGVGKPITIKLYDNDVLRSERTE